MTTDTPDTSALEEILAAARALSRQQQLELIRGLAELLVQGFAPLDSASAEFWTRRSIDDLAREQHVPVANDLRALTMPDWPEDETADDFLRFAREQRAADRAS